MIESIKNNFFDREKKQERLFIFLALASSFLINLEASITKAVSNSLFIHAYGYAYLPFAWFFLVPLNFIVVHFYNKFIPRIGLFYMFLLTTAITGIFSIFAAFFVHQYALFPFFLYLWKDLYILLMFQQLWSMLAATLSTTQAKSLYGFFWGIGGIGAVVGSCFPGFLATSIGSEKLLLVTIPFYVLLGFVFLKAIQIRDAYLIKQPISFDQKQPSNFFQGVKLIFRSKTLVFIMLIIIFMQLTSTVLDYQFNQTLEEKIYDKDLRTQYLGRFFGIVNGSNVLLQFVGSYFALHWLGVKKTHFIIPAYLGSLITGYLVFPSFNLLALSYGSIKALDYSIFGIARELLYIPLTVEEKFQGRAVIDVFVYRTAKAVASCCIFAVNLFSISTALTILPRLLLVVFVIWSLTVLFLLNEPKSEVESLDLTPDQAAD